MAHELRGKRIAVLATDGVEATELQKPCDAAEQVGASVELFSMRPCAIQGVHGVDKANTFPVTSTVEMASPDAFDGLVLPGGVADPDKLRVNKAAVAFAKSFFEGPHRPRIGRESLQTRRGPSRAWPPARFGFLRGPRARPSPMRVWHDSRRGARALAARRPRAWPSASPREARGSWGLKQGATVPGPSAGSTAQSPCSSPTPRRARSGASAPRSPESAS